jgi:hypothetical protein
MTAPGARIRSIASRLCRPETMERVIDPIVADLQCEYREAVVRGTRWTARLSLVRSYVGLASALIWLAVRYACDPRISNPGSEVARTGIVSVLALTALTVALVIPSLVNWPWRKADPLFGALLSVTLVPQALVLSIPAALSLGVVWATRGTVVSWRRLYSIVALAIVSTAVVWTILEYMMPAANQAFRVMVASRLAGHMVRLDPGLSELGLSRLGQRSDFAAVWHYHVLWSLCFASIPLSLFALGLARHVRRAVSAIGLAIALSISYMECIRLLHAVPSGLPVPPFVLAWMPNVIFLLGACALLLGGQRRPAI